MPRSNGRLRAQGRFTVPDPDSSLYLDVERVKFNHPRRRSAGQSSSDVELRRTICRLVNDKADRIVSHLSRRFRHIYRIDPTRWKASTSMSGIDPGGGRFWELSVECARRQLTAGAAPVAEFGKLDDADAPESEPYGKPPREIAIIEAIPGRHWTRYFPPLLGA